MSDGPRVLAVSATGLFSGAERVLLRALDAAKDRGWMVRCAAPDGPLVAALADAGIERIRIPELKPPPGKGARAVLALGASAIRGARPLRRASADADVILVNGLLALPALRLARPSPPVAWIVHDVISRPDWVRLLRLCRRVVTRAVAVSHAAATPLRVGGIDTVVVPNGTAWPVDPAPAPDPTRPPVVGIGALITWWKGHDVLLDALALLPSDVRLEVMGGHFPADAGFVDRLRARAARPDLAGRVTFVGHVTDPLSHLRTWSVAVNASTEPEAASLAVLEALSVGVPLVATDVGGNPEEVGDAGLLVPPGDPMRLAEAIRSILDDDEVSQRLRAAGPRRVATRFALSQQVDALLDAVAVVAGRTSPDRPGPMGRGRQ
jgi:glycosyltransferase involved in cell wall biosynthesis